MNKVRLVLGYIAGFSLFVFLIPFGLYKVSLHTHAPIFRDGVVPLIIALPFFVTGIWFALWSNISLLFRGEGGPADFFDISISPRTKKLVVKGPYQFTRNPMVFGASAMYFAISVFLNSWLCLLLWLIFFIFIIIYLKTFEEKRLLRDFGDQYEAYRKKTSMIIPWFSKD